MKSTKMIRSRGGIHTTTKSTPPIRGANEVGSSGHIPSKEFSKDLMQNLMIKLLTEY